MPSYALTSERCHGGVLLSVKSPVCRYSLARSSAGFTVARLAATPPWLYRFIVETEEAFDTAAPTMIKRRHKEHEAWMIRLHASSWLRQWGMIRSPARWRAQREKQTPAVRRKKEGWRTCRADRLERDDSRGRVVGGREDGVLVSPDVDPHRRDAWRKAHSDGSRSARAASIRIGSSVACAPHAAIDVSRLYTHACAQPLLCVSSLHSEKRGVDGRAGVEVSGCMRRCNCNQT